MLNFGTTLLFVAVTTAIALKSTPLLLHWLGAERFGGSKVVFDGYGYLTILEFGLGGALGPLLARALQADDQQAVARTVAAGARAYVWVALGMIGLGLAATPFVHLLARDLTGALVFDLRRAWVVGLFAFASLVLAPTRTVVDARQRGYVINLLLTAQSLLVTGLSLLLAWADWGITGQSLAQATGVWAFALTMTAIAIRSHPGLVRATLLEAPDPDARRALWALSTPTLLFGFCGRVGFLTDNLVVGGVLGTERVANLFNTQRLVTLGQSILGSVGNASWAALAELHGQGERAVFNVRLIEITRIVAVLAAIGFVPVVAFNRPFVKLWLGDTDFVYGGDLVVAVAALNAVLLAEHSLWAWCFTATGKVRQLLPLSVAATVLNLIASIAFTRRLGIVGPLLGTTVAFASVGLWLLVWRLNREFGTPVVALVSAVAAPTAAGAAVAGALWWLTFDHGPTSWLGIAAAMGVSALGMAGLSWVVLLTARDRDLWKQRLAPVLNRLRPPWNSPTGVGS